ncbi:MAG: hypothetical protein LBG77_05755 [Dysgonamonadaceae bacterium]|nr:hypothetical protein [Dysgonamonadaceae bacterium]
MQKYLNNLDSIDAVYYAAVNRKKGLSKVIIIPLNNAGTVHLGFTLREFEELKTMIRNYLTNDPKVFRINTKSYDFQALILN